MTCNRTNDARDPRTSVAESTTVPLTPGVPFSAIVHLTRDDCGPPIHDDSTGDLNRARIAEAAASLAVQCEVAEEADALLGTVRFVGAGSQFCYRSSSLVAPSWQGTLSIPEGMHRLRLTSEAELDLEHWSDPDGASCVAYVDGEPVDPIFQGVGRLATRYFAGPAEIVVGLDCPRLAGRSCYDVATEEGSTRRFLALTYHVDRVE